MTTVACPCVAGQAPAAGGPIQDDGVECDISGGERRCGVGEDDRVPPGAAPFIWPGGWRGRTSLTDAASLSTVSASSDLMSMLGVTGHSGGKQAAEAACKARQKERLEDVATAGRRRGGNVLLSINRNVVGQACPFASEREQTPYEMRLGCRMPKVSRRRSPTRCPQQHLAPPRHI